jgi:hypothetical protein
MWDFLDPVPGGSGDAQVFQQSPKPAGGTGASAPKDYTSSASKYIFSFSVSLWGGCSSSALSSTSWFFGCCCSSEMSPEPLGSRGPPALSKKGHPHVMHAEAHRVVTPGAVEHSEVPANQWADGRCSCVWCGECEPSIM